MITRGSSGEVWRVDTCPGEKRVAVKIMFVEGSSVQARRACEVAEVLCHAEADVSRYVYMKVLKEYSCYNTFLGI